MKSVQEELKQFKEEQAALLLQTSREEIAAIAQAVGYDSPSRFTTAFREQFGEVPTEFRKHRMTEADRAELTRRDCGCAVCRRAAAPEEKD